MREVEERVEERVAYRVCVVGELSWERVELGES